MEGAAPIPNGRLLHSASLDRQGASVASCAAPKLICDPAYIAESADQARSNANVITTPTHNIVVIRPIPINMLGKFLVV